MRGSAPSTAARPKEKVAVNSRVEPVPKHPEPALRGGSTCTDDARPHADGHDLSSRWPG
jgi:hypothetical protein